MKNPNDYKAGFTQPIQGPDGMLYGGAARNFRLGLIGGATGLQAQTLAAVDAAISPVLAQNQQTMLQMQQMLQMQHEMLKRMRRDDDDFSAAFA